MLNVIGSRKVNAIYTDKKMKKVFSEDHVIGSENIHWSLESIL